jgi:prepilin peptidase CpaA
MLPPMTLAAAIGGGLFVALLLWAMLSDLARFQIPNSVPIGLVLGFALAAVLAGLPWDQAARHVAVAMAMFLVGAALHFTVTFGAGDVKLIAAVSLWFGWPLVLPLVLAIAVAGGLVTLTLLLFRRISMPRGLLQPAWISALHQRHGHVPYGVAIGLGALVLLPRITWLQI